MDLNTIEGLTDEQKAAISAAIESETAGLKAKNEELLTEKKTAAQKAKEAQEQAENARIAAQEAEKQRLANDGKFDELKALHEREIAEATAKSEQLAQERLDAITSRDKSSVLNGALSLIHDDYKGISEAMLSNMINVEYNEQNQPVTAFKHNGEVVANNVDEFKSWALTQDSFKKILNGVDSSGAGASGNNGASGSNDTDADYKQRLKAAGLT